MCEKLSKRAKISGAVNTIYMKDGKLHGDNTDGAGFALDLKRLEQSLCNKNILLLGAGGAARNIISEIADLNPKFIEIRNRSADKAENIKNIIGDLKNIKTTKTDKMKFDVVINSTSLSLKNILPDVRVEELNKQAFCYDLAYEKNNETVFTRWAKENECSSCGGLGMLVGQAAEAFYIWNKDMPNSKICLEKLLANKI
jgi:shikimate dehydrogenase